MNVRKRKSMCVSVCVCVCAPVSGNCLSVQYVPVGSCWVAYTHTQCFFPYGPPVCFSYIKAAKIKTPWPQYQQLQHRAYKLTIFLCLKKKAKKCKVKWNSSTFCLPLSFPSLPARLPESLHLLNSEVCAISVQHYERFPFCQCVCVCERHMGMSTVEQMDWVYITWDLGRMPSGWWNCEYFNKRKSCLSVFTQLIGMH